MLLLFSISYLFGKKLLIRFTVYVFRERLSICVLLSLLVLRVGCGASLLPIILLSILSGLFVSLRGVVRSGDDTAY